MHYNNVITNMNNAHNADEEAARWTSALEQCQNELAQSKTRVATLGEKFSEVRDCLEET